MRNIFIVNPHAGAENKVRKIREAVDNLPSYTFAEVYETTGVGDATDFIRKWSIEHPEEEVRFIACGGDGTVNEVVNGVVRNPKASFSVFPCGSGNDFVKAFGGADRFLDLEALVSCEAKPMDLLKVGDRYADNVVHFGFDTYVARVINENRAKTGHGNKNDYMKGVMKAMLHGRKNEIRIIADGELLNPDGIAMLCTVGNGQYVGGQFRCAPRAKVDDGLMEVCVVKPVSIPRFVKLLKPYTNGEHLDREDMKDMLVYRQAKQVEVQAPKGFAYSLDGEVIEENHFLIEIVENAIQIAVPER